jgi:hypothetical protein
MFVVDGVAAFFWLVVGLLKVCGLIPAFAVRDDAI